MPDPPSPEPGRDYYSVYVRNLPFSITADILRERFQIHGEIRDVYIPKDYYTGDPRGFAYVQFNNLDDGRAAIRAEDGKDLDGRTMQVTWARGDRKSGREMADRDTRPGFGRWAPAGADSPPRGTRGQFARLRVLTCSLALCAHLPHSLALPRRPAEQAPRW